MKRKILIALAAVVVIVVVGLVLLVANLGRVVKAGVEKGGTAALKVPTTLDSASVSLLGGSLGLDGLNVGSPQGFDAESMFALGHAHVEVDLGTITSDMIVINEVVIDGADITLEFAGTRTNWGTLMEGLKREAPAEPAEPEPVQEEGPGKKVVIGRILFTNGKVTVAGIPLKGQASVPLPKVELTDVGAPESADAEPGRAATVRETLAEVAGALYLAVVKAAGDVLPAEQLMAMANEAGQVAGRAGREAAERARQAADAARAAATEAAGEARERADEAARAAGDAAREATGKAGESARDAAEKAKGALRGILGGGD